jgi:hypothetical protein
MSETDLVRNILAALKMRGYWAWRVNSGVTVLGTGANKRVIRGAPAGTPDILVVLQGGRLFGLEAKTAKGRQNAAQKAWEAKAKLHGAGYAVVRSAGEALDALGVALAGRRA